ncbi:MAG TPA: cytidylate kinase-like family protein [Acidimicrobiales bacterium]|nr:cytidylate kinase-like family protein [Acidimicrobiales bacterium]
MTLAALYGAAGSVIGPRVAEELGVPFLDRQIAEGVARQSGLSEATVADVDDAPRSMLDRLAAGLGRASTISGASGGSVEHLDVQEHTVRRQVEEFLARATMSGGVAMGRGGMVVLRTVGWALHVHLGGPRQDRIAQRMAIDGIDRATAEERQRVEDGSRIDYVRRAYGVDGGDPAWYHLMLDGTAIDADTCVDLIVTAARARSRQPRPSPLI